LVTDGRGQEADGRWQEADGRWQTAGGPIKIFSISHFSFAMASIAHFETNEK
jgi:hypothetical protein